MPIPAKSSSRLRTVRIGVFFIALILYFVYGFAWPIYPGRDFESYLSYYIEYFSKDPLFPMIMLYRTPIAPLLLGASLEFLGAWGTEVLMGFFYSSSILMVFEISSYWGFRTATIASLLLLFQPSYAALFHSVSSDAPFAFLYLFWIFYVLINLKNSKFKSNKFWIWMGVICFTLILTRPSSQVCLIGCMLPFVLPNISFRQKFQFSGVFLITALTFCFAWMLHNGIRYGDYTISRTGAAQLPFFRVFTIEKIVRPENGPASKYLSELVEKHLLPREPYKTYGVTIKNFFEKGNSSTWSDLVVLSDRIVGWDSNYKLLRQVAVEAILKHPLVYLKFSLGCFKNTLLGNLQVPPPLVETYIEPRVFNPNEAVIPHGHFFWFESKPTNPWTYVDSVPERLIANPEFHLKVKALDQKMLKITKGFSERGGNEMAAKIFNKLSQVYPPMLLFVFITFFGFLYVIYKESISVFKNDPMLVGLAFMWSLSILYLLITFLGMDVVFQYRIPFDSILILTAIVASSTCVRFHTRI